MTNFLLKRLLTGAIMLFSVSFLSYFLLYLGTGNVAILILGLQAAPADIAALNEQLGINRPFLEQYFSWLGNALRLDLGQSWSSPERVSEALFPRLQVTLTIVVITTVVALLISVALGTLAALRGGWIDRVVQFLSLIGFAVPGFLVAFYLAILLAIQLPIFNAVGYTNFSDDPSEWFKSVTLPVIALALAGVAAASQQTRRAVKEALAMDYVRTLRARGLTFRRVIFKHVLRNEGGPILAIIGVQFVGMLGGAILVEQIFAIPGLGPYAVSATTMGDIPAIMGLVTVTALIVIIMNLLVELTSAALNPKVRL